VFSSVIPNCVSYDPTFSYEVAVIIHDGLRRMYVDQENIYYYVTVMNENYAHPAMPEGVEDGIRKGLYLFRAGSGGEKAKLRVQLLGSGTILREVIAAADLLEADFGVSADIWSVPSFTELRREAVDVERWNMLHPEAQPRVSYVAAQLGTRPGPLVAATDYVRTFPDQIRAYISGRYVTLGTEGYGRSDTRAKLRKFFEVNRWYVAVAALKALADEGAIPASRITEAIRKYEIDPEKPNPVKV
jgi:pyruvate dehydrogenase E1 component